MDIATRKQKLITWIASMKDEQMLERIELMHRSNKALDWNDLPQEDQDAITEGIAQLDGGQRISRSEFRHSITKRYHQK